VHLRFDGGTIVLDDPPAELDPSSLPGALWDGRVRAFRTPAYRYSELTARLRKLGVRHRDEVFSPLARDLGREARPPRLRPYQEEALRAWNGAGRRGIVVLPTGAGKTRVALASIVRTGVPTLCMVPTRVLLDQWCEQIARVFPGPVGCLGDGRHELQPLTVATFESAYRHMPRLGNRFGLVVVDEAHHFGCGGRDEALEMSTALYRLGLTATPPTDEVAISRLARLVGRTVFELVIDDLTGRFLAQYDTVTLHLDLSPQERTAYERLMASFRSVRGRLGRTMPGATWAELAAAAARSDEGRRAFQSFREASRLVAFTEAKRRALRDLLARHRDRRILIFTADNDAAYHVAREHLVMPLTCDISRAERAEAITRFQAGELRALVSARVLNEGIDVPAADLAIIVGSSLGTREHVQRVGRLLRPAPDKRALVIQMVTRGTLEVPQAKRKRAALTARSSALT